MLTFQFTIDALQSNLDLNLGSLLRTLHRVALHPYKPRLTNLAPATSTLTAKAMNAYCDDTGGSDSHVLPSQGQL